MWHFKLLTNFFVWETSGEARIHPTLRACPATSARTYDCINDTQPVSIIHRHAPPTRLRRDVTCAWILGFRSIALSVDCWRVLSVSWQISLRFFWYRLSHFGNYFSDHGFFNSWLTTDKRSFLRYFRFLLRFLLGDTIKCCKCIRNNKLDNYMVQYCFCLHSYV